MHSTVSKSYRCQNNKSTIEMAIRLLFRQHHSPYPGPQKWLSVYYSGSIIVRTQAHMYISIIIIMLTLVGLGRRLYTNHKVHKPKTRQAQECTHARTRRRAHTDKHRSAHTQTHTHTHTNMDARSRTQTHGGARTHRQVHERTRTHTSGHAHTHTARLYAAGNWVDN